MATHTYVQLKIKEARYLANLFGIEYDLKSTIDWCKKSDSLMGNRELMWLVEPITAAILIRIFRAFGSGVRNKDAMHLLEKLNEKQRKQYKYFKDVRDKHISHSINEFENNHVKATYIAEAPEKASKA